MTTPQWAPAKVVTKRGGDLDIEISNVGMGLSYKHKEGANFQVDRLNNALFEIAVPLAEHKRLKEIHEALFEELDALRDDNKKLKAENEHLTKIVNLPYLEEYERLKSELSVVRVEADRIAEAMEQRGVDATKERNKR